MELNVTFYRFPRLESLESWYNRSAENFKFSVKVPKAITHFKQFNDTERMLGDFYGTVQEGLKEKLGCVLFQLPPKASYKEERLQKIIHNINPSFNNVLEFRNPTWWNQEVYNELTRNNISFCGMSHPDLPDEIINNTSIVYYRFHGVPELYKSPYSSTQLQNFVDEIKPSKKTKAAYLYFNNDIDGSAIKNAKELKEILSK